MAQTMLLMSSVPATYSVDLKRDTLLKLQNQRLRPKFSHLFFNPSLLSAYSFSFSSLSFTTLTLFKTMTKAPPIKASLFDEAIIGKGILAQLNLKTGIPIYDEAEPLFLFFIIFVLPGAIIALSDCGKYIDDPPTILEKEVNPPGTRVRDTTGLSEGGNLKKIKVDRLLMWWWAFTGLTHIIGEGYFVFSPEFLEDKTGFFLAEVWKEYSKADSRYAERDAMVVTIEGLTALLEGPASLLAVYAIATDKSYSYILQFAISLGQLYGVAVYYITAILEGDDFSASSFYYYAYYIGANSFWIVIPSIVAIRCWRKICVALRVERDHTENS